MSTNLLALIFGWFKLNIWLTFCWFRPVDEAYPLSIWRFSILMAINMHNMVQTDGFRLTPNVRSFENICVVNSNVLFIHFPRQIHAKQNAFKGKLYLSAWRSSVPSCPTIKYRFIFAFAFVFSSSHFQINSIDNIVYWLTPTTLNISPLFEHFKDAKECGRFACGNQQYLHYHLLDCFFFVAPECFCRFM